MVSRTTSPSAKIVAALHDLVEDAEDTGFDLEDLKTLGFPSDIVNAVDAVSKRTDESENLDWYWARVCRDPLAKEVKLPTSLTTKVVSSNCPQAIPRVPPD